MKIASLPTLFFLFIACASNNFDEQKAMVAGYWEIRSVEMADGSIKEFKVTTSVDYIEVRGDSGVRKKLMPKLDGSFTEFPTSESFKFVTSGDSLIMNYSTPFATWNETIVKATNEVLVTTNKDGKRFEYKRFEKMDLGE